MNDRPTDQELSEARQAVGLPTVQTVEKDWYVVQAMRAILAVDSAPFRLVFAGGTCLARAHCVVGRMSEDVDFKVVPPAGPMSNNQRRQALGGLRDRLVDALTAAGFTLAEPPRSRDANQYTVIQLRCDGEGEAAGPLRPSIQIELSLAALRTPTVIRPVASFVNQAYNRPPELGQVECASVTETAAEKMVSLTRRTAMEMAGISRDPDPALVRHIYDLHQVRGQIEQHQVATLMRAIAAMDAEQFGHQHPAYRDDISGQTHQALQHLASDPAVQARYTRFVGAMVYGDAAPFPEAIKTVAALVEAAWP